MGNDRKGVKMKVPYGWIQWKGTDVCIDLHCICGFLGHYDGDFLYTWKCPKCKQIFKVGPNVQLKKCTKKEILEYSWNIK